MPASTTQLPQKVPALREDPWTPDRRDPTRVEYARSLWHSQDNLHIKRDRQIEENIRMLAGQQWSMYSKLLGRFVDVSHWFTERERLWRQRPVFNLLIQWFMLTHARLTENPPVVTFQPSTGDDSDAELAEAMDTVFKILWNDTSMLDVIDRIAGWLCPGGSAYWKTLVDPNIGDIIEWTGNATLSMETPTGESIQRMIEGAPLDREGNPLAQLVGSGDEWEPTGKAFREYEGGLQVDVYSPIQVRGQWSNLVPWHQKRLHMVRTFMTPEEVYDRYGVEHEPDAASQDADRTNALRRVTMGAGFFGSIESLEEGLTNFDHEGTQGYIDVLEVWQAPSNHPGQQRGVDEYEEPGGRLLTVSKTKVLRDGQRPAPYRYTSSIRHLAFVNLPGRPQGTTPQESLNPQQRTLNRRWAQILEHANLMTNPITILDKGQGIKKGDITDEPGQHVYVNRKSGQSAKPIEYASPPSLGEDSWRTLTAVRNEFTDLGNTEGGRGKAPTSDASGELVKELRFNEDRYIGPTSRRFVIELGRTVEDWIVTIPYIWSQEKTLSWAGEDRVLRTVLVTPQMFEKGSVNVIPDIESMLPEGRGQRQERIAWMWQQGAFGPKDSPEAVNKFLKLSRFPHLDRATRPGGQHRIMAETENGWLARGRSAMEVPIFEWQDHDVHLEVHTEFMAGPDYQKLPPEIQQQFLNHYQATRVAAQKAFENQLVMEAQRRMLAGSAVQDVQASLLERAGVPAQPPTDEGGGAQTPPATPEAGGPAPGEPSLPDSAVA